MRERALSKHFRSPFCIWFVEEVASRAEKIDVI
jgi:hypothetical protein